MTEHELKLLKLCGVSAEFVSCCIINIEGEFVVYFKNGDKIRFQPNYKPIPPIAKSKPKSKPKSKKK